MSTNLYEVLGLERDATEDQVRKAYKKRALQTHPDRVPPEQKTTAEEEFRKVNNAYEVLNDTTNRRAYDKAGIWPPPPPVSERFRHHRRPRHSSTREQYVPFPDDPFDFPWPHHTGFTDPFRLFESIFGEMRHTMADPFFSDRRRDRRHDLHHRGTGSFFDDSFVGMGFPFDRGNVFDDVLNSGNGRSRAYSQVSHGAMGPDGRWVSESRMTRSINGVTESVWKRRDAAGNEYATYTYPDGRERHTVNGREQIAAQKHVQPQRVQKTTPPPPPPIQTSVVSPPPPPYSTSATSRKRDSPTSTSSRRRESPNRELQSPIEIQSSSHAGSPPPVSHHYRSPSTVHHDRAYSHETPHYKSRWWKR